MTQPKILFTRAAGKNGPMVVDCDDGNTYFIDPCVPLPKEKRWHRQRYGMGIGDRVLPSSWKKNAGGVAT